MKSRRKTAPHGGAKMLLADVLEIPILAALGIVAGILAASVIVSLHRPPPRPAGVGC